MNIFICPPPIDLIAYMNMIIAVGFGSAYVTCDGQVVYEEPREPRNWLDFWTVEDAEREAIKSPEKIWKIYMNGPLQGRLYQRMGANKWLLIEKYRGFA